MLVRTPAPMPTESLFGYVLRVSETNGYDTPLHVLNYAGYESGSMRSSKFLVDKLAKILGRNVSELEAIAYSIIQDNGKRTFMILNHNLGTSLPSYILRLKRPSFCPKCVQEQKIIDKFWDLYFAVACPKHGCQLLRTCPTCNRDLHWFRPGLLTCSCGTNLINTILEPASTDVIELMAIMKAKLHTESILNLPNSSLYPIQELENQSFRSFIWLTERLGNYSLFGQDINEIIDPYSTMKAAAEVLCDWPSGYHKFLHQLGMKLTMGGNPTSSGLRKQFEQYFVPMFKTYRNTYVDSKFLRDEFIRFGLSYWGKATVDNKLLKNTETDIENRFFSLSRLASELGISPVTLKLWLKKGLIPCEKIMVGNKARYIFDAEAIDLAKRAPGEIMNAREAAAMARVPVSVLKALRKSGHFIVEHIPKHKAGFHEADLINFSRKILQKSVMITEENKNGSQCISLDYILQEKRFWSNNGKAIFVAAYLDGIIQSVGRTGDSLEYIWFHEADVKASLSVNRSNVNDKTISQQEAAKAIGCGIEIISVLIENEYLIAQLGPNRKRVEPESVKKFISLYVTLSSLAEQLNTSSIRLLKLCQKSGIDVLCMARKRGAIAPFIKHEDQKKLIEQELLNPTRTERQKIANQNHITCLTKLKHYFDSLRESGTPLPRRGLIPNIREIASASGMARNIFYDNPEAVSMLDKFDEEERKFMGIKKRDDIGDLQQYLEELKRSNSILPRNTNGQPNKVAIAKACGIDRNIFYSNPDAAAVLKKYSSEMRQND